ncbi:MAG: hypothetical protein K0U84_13590 [Actinomycetia bacterium]|nr:hypothetical protein [Actinomycetes bacterium]
MSAIPDLGGWASLDTLDAEVLAAQEETNREREQLRMSFIACFSSPAGKRVLEDLKNWALTQEGFDHNRGFHDGAAQGFYREGQRRVVAYIMKMSEPMTEKD